MRQKNSYYIGSTEERINKFLRMCLQWQFDRKRGEEKKSSHYFAKYHVGKYPKHFFDDLATSVVDRKYVIGKMNAISEYRMKRDRNLGINSNKVVIVEVDGNTYSPHRMKIGEDTVIRKVVGEEATKLHDVSTSALLEELSRRQNNFNKK